MISVISYCLFALLVVGATMVKRRVPRQVMLLIESSATSRGDHREGRIERRA